MSRVSLLDATRAAPASRELLEQIQRTFGATPAMFRAVAHSPAALRSMWGAFAALAGGQLDKQLSEQIAVAVAERNACAYCLAAHTALGRKAGASAQAMSDAQRGTSTDARSAVALRFALELVERRGHVPHVEVMAMFEAGFSEADLVEIVAHVALNLFTNYVNVAFEVPLDFPAVNFQAPMRAEEARLSARTT